MPPSAEISLSLSGLDLRHLRFALNLAIDDLSWWRPQEAKVRRELEILRDRIKMQEILAQRMHFSKEPDAQPTLTSS